MSNIIKPTLTQALGPSRREFLSMCSAATAIGLLGSVGLTGCGKEKEPLLRIAANVFPGYELLFLAAERDYFQSSNIRLQTMPSATACLQALAAGNVEGATLTLDEVISARADNMPLKIIAVLDVSLGADVVLAKPQITTLNQLKGKRVAVEQSAVGAVMLNAALENADLNIKDIEIIYATFDQHYDLFTQNKVDALVTFEPLPKILAQGSFTSLFNSSMVAGLIIDVLAVRPDVIEERSDTLQRLVAGHFKALAELKNSPASASEIISRRLGIEPKDVPAAYTGLDLPDVAANRAWLTSQPSKLETAALKLQEEMIKANLMHHTTDLSDLIDNRFLPISDTL